MEEAVQSLDLAGRQGDCRGAAVDRVWRSVAVTFAERGACALCPLLDDHQSVPLLISATFKDAIWHQVSWQVIWTHQAHVMHFTFSRVVGSPWRWLIFSHGLFLTAVPAHSWYTTRPIVVFLSPCTRMTFLGVTTMLSSYITVKFLNLLVSKTNFCFPFCRLRASI